MNKFLKIFFVFAICHLPSYICHAQQNYSSKNKKAIHPALAEHKIAAKHHEEAAKFHYEAVKHLETGNHQKAKESTDKAHGIMSLLSKIREKISNYYNSKR